MSEEKNSGTAQASGTVQPASSGNGTDPANPPQDASQKIAELERKAEENAKAKAELQELQTYFSQRPDLFEAAMRWDKDQNFQSHIKAYKGTNGDNHTPGESKAKEPDLSSLTEEQRAAVGTYIRQQLEEHIKPFSAEMGQLKQFYAQHQIEGLRSKFTAANGYPVDFSEKEAEVAAMLRDGRAATADGAYLQLVGGMFPKFKTDFDKRLVEEKRQISMSRSSAPTSYVMKRDNDKPMTFVEALRIANEKVGK